MADGHVRGQCATLVSEAEGATLTAKATAAEEEELGGVEGMPKTKRRKLLEQEDKPVGVLGGGGEGGGGEVVVSSSSSSSSSSSINNKNKKGNSSSSSNSNKQRKKSCCSICLHEGHNKTKCMNKNDPSIVPPVGPIRALAYPPDPLKPTKYVYLDLEWTTDGEFEIIEIGCVPRRHCCSSSSEEGGGEDGKEDRWEPAGEVFSSLIRTRRPKTDKQLGANVHHISGKKKSGTHTWIYWLLYR